MTQIPPGHEDAMSAVEALEKMTSFDDVLVGIAGDPGRTYPELRKIAALGQAGFPYLERLSDSPNPVARAVAAEGLGELCFEAALPILERRLEDDAPVPTMSGCLVRQSPVWQFAQRAFARSLPPLGEERYRELEPLLTTANQFYSSAGEVHSAHDRRQKALRILADHGNGPAANGAATVLQYFMHIEAAEARALIDELGRHADSPVPEPPPPPPPPREKNLLLIRAAQMVLAWRRVSQRYSGVRAVRAAAAMIAHDMNLHIETATALASALLEETGDRTG
jgi:hypothetical protein